MATTIDDVKKLAALSRISINDAELVTFTKEFDAILAYVGQLEHLPSLQAADELPSLHTVLRKDGEPHAPGEYTEKLAAQFPQREGDYLAVKQIIQND